MNFCNKKTKKKKETNKKDFYQNYFISFFHILAKLTIRNYVHFDLDIGRGRGRGRERGEGRQRATNVKLAG